MFYLKQGTQDVWAYNNFIYLQKTSMPESVYLKTFVHVFLTDPGLVKSHDFNMQISNLLDQDV